MNKSQPFYMAIIAIGLYLSQGVSATIGECRRHAYTQEQFKELCCWYDSLNNKYSCKAGCTGQCNNYSDLLCTCSNPLVLCRALDYFDKDQVKDIIIPAGKSYQYNISWAFKFVNGRTNLPPECPVYCKRAIFQNGVSQHNSNFIVSSHDKQDVTSMYLNTTGLDPGESTWKFRCVLGWGSNSIVFTDDITITSSCDHPEAYTNTTSLPFGSIRVPRNANGLVEKKVVENKYVGGVWQNSQFCNIGNHFSDCSIRHLSNGSESSWLKLKHIEQNNFDIFIDETQVYAPQNFHIKCKNQDGLEIISSHFAAEVHDCSSASQYPVKTGLANPLYSVPHAYVDSNQQYQKIVTFQMSTFWNFDQCSVSYVESCSWAHGTSGHLAVSLIDYTIGNSAIDIKLNTEWGTVTQPGYLQCILTGNGQLIKSDLFYIRFTPPDCNAYNTYQLNKVQERIGRHFYMMQCSSGFNKVIHYHHLYNAGARGCNLIDCQLKDNSNESNTGWYSNIGFTVKNVDWGQFNVQLDGQHLLKSQPPIWVRLHCKTDPPGLANLGPTYYSYPIQLPGITPNCSSSCAWALNAVPSQTFWQYQNSSSTDVNSVSWTVNFYTEIFARESTKCKFIECKLVLASDNSTIFGAFTASNGIQSDGSSTFSFSTASRVGQQLRFRCNNTAIFFYSQPFQFTIDQAPLNNVDVWTKNLPTTNVAITDVFKVGWKSITEEIELPQVFDPMSFYAPNKETISCKFVDADSNADIPWIIYRRYSTNEKLKYSINTDQIRKKTKMRVFCQIPNGSGTLDVYSAPFEIEVLANCEHRNSYLNQSSLPGSVSNFIKEQYDSSGPLFGKNVSVLTDIDEFFIRPAECTPKYCFIAAHDGSKCDYLDGSTSKKDPHFQYGNSLYGLQQTPSFSTELPIDKKNICYACYIGLQGQDPVSTSMISSRPFEFEVKMVDCENVSINPIQPIEYAITEAPETKLTYELHKIFAYTIYNKCNFIEYSLQQVGGAPFTVPTPNLIFTNQDGNASISIVTYYRLPKTEFEMVIKIRGNTGYNSRVKRTVNGTITCEKCLKNSTQLLFAEEWQTMHLLTYSPDTDKYVFRGFSKPVSTNPACPIVAVKLTKSIEDPKNSTCFNQLSDDILVADDKKVDLVLQTANCLGFIATHNIVLHVTAKDGIVAKQRLNLAIKVDCKKDTIKYSKQVPDKYATLFKDMGSYQQLQMQLAGDQIERVDLSRSFKTTLPSCRIFSMEITKVTVGEKVLELEKASKFFTLSLNGTFEVLGKVTEDMSDVLVFVRAFNGDLYAGDDNALIKLDFRKPEVLTKIKFKTPARPFNIDLRNFNQKEETKLNLPLPEVDEAIQSAELIGAKFAEVTYDVGKPNTTPTLAIDLKQMPSLGSYSFKIKLVPTKGIENIINLNVMIRDGENVAGDSQIVKRNIEEIKRKKKLSANITKIDSLGMVTIVFSEPMLTSFNLSHLNESLMDIYVKPSQESESLETFNISMVNITSWKVISFKEKKLELQVNFTMPLYISQSQQQDTLIVQFYENASSVIKTKNDERHLDEEKRTLKSPLRAQQQLNAATKAIKESTQSGTDGVSAIVVIAIIFSFFGNGGAIYTVLLIQALQIILHLPMMRIVFPANVTSFVAVTIKIAMFDFLDTFLDWEEQTLLDFDFNIDSGVSDQTKDIGYNSHNAVMNLNSVAVFIVIYFAQVIVYLFAACCKKLCKCKKKSCWSKFTVWMRKDLFWNAILTLALEGYVEMLIAGMVNTKHLRADKSGEVLGAIYCIICLLLTLFIAPAALIWMLLTKNDQRIQKDKFQSKWGALVSEIRTQTRGRRAFYLVWITRRFIFTMSCLYITEEYQSIQMLIIFETMQPYLIYVTSQYARERTLYNRIEIMNEWVCIACTYHSLLFTNFVQNQEQKQMFGNSFIGLTLLMTFINLIFVLKEMVKQLWLIILKYGRRYTREDPMMKPLQLKRRQDYSRVETANKLDATIDDQIPAKTKVPDCVKEMLEVAKRRVKKKGIWRPAKQIKQSQLEPIAEEPEQHPEDKHDEPVEEDEQERQQRELDEKFLAFYRKFEAYFDDEVPLHSMDYVSSVTEMNQLPEDVRKNAYSIDDDEGLRDAKTTLLSNLALTTIIGRIDVQFPDIDHEAYEKGASVFWQQY